MPGPAKVTDEVRRARRVEAGVYVFAAVTFVVLGVFLTSKIMNWIVGPAYVVTVVVFVTPFVLRLLGIADPDQKPPKNLNPP